jgi:hypothetical protein
MALKRIKNNNAVEASARMTKLVVTYNNVWQSATAAARYTVAVVQYPRVPIRDKKYAIIGILNGSPLRIILYSSGIAMSQSYTKAERVATNK